MNSRKLILAAGIAASYLFSGGLAFATDAAQQQADPDAVSKEKVEEIVEESGEKDQEVPDGSWFTGETADHESDWDEADKKQDVSKERLDEILDEARKKEKAESEGSWARSQSDTLDPDVDRADENPVTEAKVDEVVESAKGNEGAKPDGSWFTGESEDHEPYWDEADKEQPEAPETKKKYDD